MTKVTETDIQHEGAPIEPKCRENFFNSFRYDLVSETRYNLQSLAGVFQPYSEQNPQQPSDDNKGVNKVTTFTSRALLGDNEERTICKAAAKFQFSADGYGRFQGGHAIESWKVIGLLNKDGSLETKVHGGSLSYGLNSDWKLLGIEGTIEARLYDIHQSLTDNQADWPIRPSSEVSGDDALIESKSTQDCGTQTGDNEYSAELEILPTTTCVEGC
ncbi:hypothetical protein Cyrtocomes_00531 [Candidatus Cyrtobacter comes]|uniref:Uncharacterized protein n=1 Tax=Candidatus Cyrtobacter comes TaxID=675776 RepID=A0ABU5L8E6_9RICK|nr:hypothetical protein [Candidatus Cyrtobacter comes]MDZ5762160.1 hypothetical protein [Candidatus Cyrtobacter comes]